MDAQTFLRMRQIEDEHWWFSARRRIVSEVIASLALPPQPRILDAGCGTGGILPALAAFGPVIGVEADEEAVELARGRNVGTVYRGSLPDDMPAECANSDLVVLADVLEHIEEEDRSLAAVRRLMNPGGYVLLTVPAWPFLWGRYDVKHHHKRRYVAETLRATVERSGLVLTHMTYYNTVLFPLMAAVRLADRMWPRSYDTDDLAIPPRPLNRMLEGLFASERHVVPRVRLPFGVSLLAVARNPQ